MIPLLVLGAALAAEPPSFGAELSAGLGAGTLVSDWTVPGPQGFLLARYTAFARPATREEPRVGVSIFASATAWPRQHAQEWVDDELVDQGPFEMLHYGLLAALHQPLAPRWDAWTALGWTRIDLQDWYGGVQAIPVALGEVGLRRHRRGPPPRAHAELLLRGGWGNARDHEGAWGDWWLVQLVALGGYELR